MWAHTANGIQIHDIIDPTNNIRTINNTDVHEPNLTFRTDRQRTYDVTLRRVRVPTAAMETQQYVPYLL